ncbi:MAG TPA: HD domain-containing protein, partial [Myxococcota bacterium]
ERDTIDVALPRTESKVGSGHRGFVVESDPHMSFRDAAARRDFTINAIGVDLVTGELLDPWHGVDDLRAGILRHVSPAFDEDPLRVLRAAQFAARFGFVVDDSTVERCRALQGELPSLAVERIGEELKKLLIKGVWPSLGLQVLKRVGALEVLFPELQALVGCPQEFEWHPEGDVWVHTLMVTDEAARLARHDQLDDEQHLICTLAALCHDLGKPATTQLEGGRIRSRDHESQGEAPTRAFCARLGITQGMQDVVVDLVKDHLKPFMLWRDREIIGDAVIRRLALRVSVPMLCRVATADHFGRTTPEALAHDDPAGPWLLDKARALAVADAAPTPLLLGRDLQALGLKPGKAFGVLLKEAFEAQLDGQFADHDGAVVWLKQRVQEQP